MATASERRITIQQSQPGRALAKFAGEAVIWAFLIIMALIEFAPISWMFSTSLRDPSRSFDLPPLPGTRI